ncbi:DUF4386 domain-containing protein [Corynebacterium sp. A21]|uniref:DUF4386 domain-containing protein n=1 Tax=Corynebacterium sp. A21 TaxID=3457318 RepID=UPI003FD36A7A
MTVSARIIAGLALLGMAILAPIAHFGFLEAHRRDNDRATVRSFTESWADFPWALACLSGVVILDVIVALALYRVFFGYEQRLSAIAAGLRLLYAAGFAVALSFLYRLYAAPGTVADQLIPQLAAFDRWWDVSLIFFAGHLLVLGWLCLRRRGLPGWLGVLLIVAGLGYLADSILALSRIDLGVEFSVVTFLGEVLLIGWLLVTGARNQLRRSTKASQR